MTHALDEFAALDHPDAPPPPPEPRRHRVPPHDDAAEQAVLSAMLLDRAAITATASLLEDSAFYREAHRRIYRAIHELIASGSVPDVLTLADQLAHRGELEACGGKDYLAQLIDAVATAANVRYHAAIVREHARRRHIITACSTGLEAAFDGRIPATDIVQDTTAALVPLAVDDASRAGFQRVSVWPVMELIERRMKGEVPLGYMTGIRSLDEHTNGYLPGQLIFVAAVAKGAKSVLSHQMAVYHALQGHAAAIVSAEMETSVVVERMLVSWSGVPAGATRSGRLSDRDIRRLIETGTALERAKLWIDDAAQPSWDDVRARVTGLKAQHPELTMVVVDFLQLVRYQLKGRRGDEELKELAYGLKGLAKKLGLILIVPCQLNYKDIEKRPDKRPELQDLQGSSGMVQAADQVILLYRPAMYFPDHAQNIELIVPAGGTRITPAFTAHAWWRGPTMRIANDEFDPPTATDTQSELLPA